MTFRERSGNRGTGGSLSVPLFRRRRGAERRNGQRADPQPMNEAERLAVLFSRYEGLCAPLNARSR
jgi:hypothetical protein